MRDYLFAAAGGGASLGAARAALGAAHPGGRTDRLLLGETAEGVAFDGIAVFGDALVRDAHGAAALARGPGRGDYLLARHGADGAVSIETDPLGYYPLFVHHEGGLLCAGNRVEQVAAVVESLGGRAERDLSVHAWFTLQGSAVGFPSARAGISLLPLGARIEVDARNRASLPRRPARDILYSDRPLAELADEAAGEILGNLRALAAGDFDHRVCDLTGGIDSRLVAAAVLHEGVEDAFLFHTIGSHPNPDANVAALIRQRFGLRRGTGIHPVSDVRRTPLEWLRTTVGETSGLMSTFFRVAPSAPEPSRHLWIGGGSGELLREFWPSGGGEAPPSRGVLARLLRRPAPVAPSPLAANVESVRRRARLLSAERREAAAAAMERFAAESLAEGVAPEHVGDHLYLASRARYHFGLFWATSPRARFHPLYSPAAVRAAHAMPNEDKAAGRLALELMRRFRPELIDLPFANKRWPAHLVPDAPEPVTRSTPPLAEGREPRSVTIHPRPKGKGGGGPRTEVERRLLAKGAKSREVELGRMLEEVRAAGLDLDALAPAFDAGAARAFLARAPDGFSGATDADDAYRVVAAAVWANGLEIGPQGG